MALTSWVGVDKGGPSDGAEGRGNGTGETEGGGPPGPEELGSGIEVEVTDSDVWAATTAIQKLVRRNMAVEVASTFSYQSEYYI